MALLVLGVIIGNETVTKEHRVKALYHRLGGSPNLLYKP